MVVSIFKKANNSIDQPLNFSCNISCVLYLCIYIFNNQKKIKKIIKSNKSKMKFVKVFLAASALHAGAFGNLDPCGKYSSDDGDNFW